MDLVFLQVQRLKLFMLPLPFHSLNLRQEIILLSQVQILPSTGKSSEGVTVPTILSLLSEFKCFREALLEAGVNWHFTVDVVKIVRNVEKAWSRAEPPLLSCRSNI
jgi:hypothetical protein